MANAPDPVDRISEELQIPKRGVAAVVALLGEGATVPFIARYRKERTGGLDEVQIRAISERQTYLGELDKRRAAILKSIEEQGALTDTLRKKIAAATTKAELEDLYLPFKKKRKTRAVKARERGLEPLANRILEQPADGDPAGEAAAFVNEELEVPDASTALAGARDIVAEHIAETASIRSRVRTEFAERGELVVAASRTAGDAPTKFEQYYDFRERVSSIPSHRFLAIRRGEADGILRAQMEVDEERLLGEITRQVGLSPRSPFAGELRAAAEDGFRRLLAPSIENELRIELKMRSDRSAVDVFAENLRHLLLSAPLGGQPVLGVDPGLRTGCKCAVVDATGRFIDSTTVFTTKGGHGEVDKLARFLGKHSVHAIAIGNGTGNREAEKLVRDAVAAADVRNVSVISVNEAGASVYSASDVAREEFPELDVTVRGAISIARRLQDPLAELVKIEPKAIGVGQYQHDVHQPLLARKLGEVVESCVNHVGVALNTASAPLLSHVAGIGPALAKKIVNHRDRAGAFASRKELLKVEGLGKRAFEQSAGFLRIRGGKNPLDASAVHPERYKLVEKMAGEVGVGITDLIGNRDRIRAIDIKKHISDGVGEPTLKDILDELEKPGRDPRADFEAPAFREDIRELEDLSEGMKLEGVVTNVTAFGAFVDVGVHQDGLVHISELSDQFVKDPAEVVKVGQRLKVTVLEVDTARRRIALSAKKQPGKRSTGTPAKGPANKPAKREGGRKNDRRGDQQRSSGKRKPAGSDGGGALRHNPFAKLKR